MVFGHNVFGIGGQGIGNDIFRAEGTTADFTGEKVKIWEHCMSDENFSTGWTMELGEGEYDRETLDPDGKNDSISAIWIPEGYTVIAHQNYIDDDSTGETWTWIGPTSKTCLGDGSGAANDQISYLKVIYTGGDDPNNCASKKRQVKDDNTCGDCITGYSVVNGECVEDEEEEQEWYEKPLNQVLGVLGVVMLMSFKTD
jgi:hypothetical protein